MKIQNETPNKEHQTTFEQQQLEATNLNEIYFYQMKIQNETNKKNIQVIGNN